MADVSDSSAPLRDVCRVQFGILSPDEIVRFQALPTVNFTIIIVSDRRSDCKVEKNW